MNSVILAIKCAILGHAVDDFASLDFEADQTPYSAGYGANQVWEAGVDESFGGYSPPGCHVVSDFC